jgi:hypothetical protein
MSALSPEDLQFLDRVTSVAIAPVDPPPGAHESRTVVPAHDHDGGEDSYVVRGSCGIVTRAA